MTQPTSTLQWLGQAGFVLRRGADGVVFDPYLSDLCRRVHGLERQVPAPATPSQLRVDAVLISHWHEDHLDLDSAAEFAAAGALFVGPPSCTARLAGIGIDARQLAPLPAGQVVQVGAFTVTAVPARHRVPGFLTEDAVGYVVDTGDARVYHSGDTEYDRSLLTVAAGGPLDAALVCVNGTGGNMNAVEAAALLSQLRPSLAVPMHFGMWPEASYGEGATLDPRYFEDLYRRLYPQARVRIPQLGETWTVSA